MRVVFVVDLLAEQLAQEGAHPGALVCRALVKQVRALGHSAYVLTSQHLWRYFEDYLVWQDVEPSGKDAQAAARAIAAAIRPDLVVAWEPWRDGATRKLARALADTGFRAVSLGSAGDAAAPSILAEPGVQATEPPAESRSPERLFALSQLTSPEAALALLRSGGAEVAACGDPRERLVPDWSTSSTSQALHLSRYGFARRYVKGQRVLDLGCGTGYGARLLAIAGAERVVAVDRSPEALIWALAGAPQERLLFICGDAFAWPLRAAASDVVVAFELLEHLVDQRSFLRSLVAAMKDDGTLLISTPNRMVYRAVLQHAGVVNPFHVSELLPWEFEALLRDHFGEVRVMGQRLAPAFVQRVHTWLRLRELQAQASGLQTQVRALQAQVTALNGQVSALNGQVCALSERVLGFEGGATYLDGKIAALERALRYGLFLEVPKSLLRRLLRRTQGESRQSPSTGPDQVAAEPPAPSPVHAATAEPLPETRSDDEIAVSLRDLDQLPPFTAPGEVEFVELAPEFCEILVAVCRRPVLGARKR